METISLLADIPVFYVTAASYPEGIIAAHEKLRRIVPFLAERRYFGISKPEGHGIVYRACAEELQSGEGKQYGCDTLLLEHGLYNSMLIRNYAKDIPAIGKAFEHLLAIPGIDAEGYCVEWYINDSDVRCMVRLSG